jgi:hypothetical protein
MGPVDTVRSEQKRAVREAQIAWVRRVIAHTGKSASQLAEDAGLAGLTLTRFLNQENYEGTLSPLSVRLLTEYTGLPGPDQGDDVKAGRFSFQEGAPFDYTAADQGIPGMGQIVRLFLQNRPGASPWELQTNALEAVGYLQGDIVIVDQNVIAKVRDAVCAQVYDLKGGAETIFRIYEPPVLTGATHDPETRPRPMVVDNVSVKIMGVITDALRTSRGRR